ncbi:MAG TPA: winged helix-turn-helix domain-containing protein [Blastocatellia bacterium]|jgi:Tol biopolymer transport system component/DNA-binding winged helix-turn-helix (wHTH) protein
MKNHESVVFAFDDVQVEPGTFGVLKAGRQIPIEPKAFNVLLFLIENRGRLIKKEELLGALWKDTYVTENALTREIARLRKILGDDPKQARYIQTVHTRGYRFIAEVQVRNGESKNWHETYEDQSDQSVEVETAEHDRDANPFAPSGVSHIEARAKSESNLHARRFFSRRTLLLLAVTICSLLCAIAYAAWRSLPYIPFSTITVGEMIPVTSSPGLKLNPTLSPDGSTVVYSSDRTGGFELYARPLVSGGREVQLTFDGNRNLEPAWSPDGKFIAYHSAKRGGIWLIPALGGAGRQLTDLGCHPAWSRDSKMIAYQSESLHEMIQPFASSATIWVVPAERGERKQITQPGNPAGGHLFPTWSPDGKHIAFLDGDQESMQIWSIALTGEQLTPVTARQSFTKADLIWAPDGNGIFYAMGTMLFRQRVAPESGAPVGKPSKVADLGGTVLRNPTISADGTKIAYSAWTAKSNLLSLRLSPVRYEATGNPNALTNETNSRNGLPAFSPSGKEIAFVSERRGEGYQLWLMDAAGNNPTQLTTAPSQAVSPVWYSGGEQIAFQSFQAERSTLSSVTVKNGEERILSPADGLGFLRLSPDGKLAAFNYSPGGFSNIGVTSCQGGSPRQLTFETTFTGFPSWSPDGQFIAYQTKCGDYQQVMAMPGSGGTAVQLTFENGDSWPFGWSPDGEKIAFAGSRNGIWNIWWVSRLDKSQRQLTRNSKAGVLMRFPAWSPLGNQIVYEQVELTSNIYVMDLK